MLNIRLRKERTRGGTQHSQMKSQPRQSRSYLNLSLSEGGWERVEHQRTATHTKRGRGGRRGLGRCFSPSSQDPSPPAGRPHLPRPLPLHADPSRKLCRRWSLKVVYGTGSHRATRTQTWRACPGPSRVPPSPHRRSPIFQWGFPGAVEFPHRPSGPLDLRKG